jgi:hypothetical protein
MGSVAIASEDTMNPSDYDPIAVEIHRRALQSITNEMVLTLVLVLACGFASIKIRLWARRAKVSP